MATDNGYEMALERRRKLLAELEEVEQFISLWQRLFGTNQAAGLGTIAQTVAPVAPNVRSRPIASQSDFDQVAREVFTKRGRPATRGEFVKLLGEHGRSVSGADATKVMKNVGTKLWRSKNIVHIDGHGYWLRDQPCPAVGYRPEHGAASTASGHKPEIKAQSNGIGALLT